MILIADSGSTKTDWCLLQGSKPILRINTQGINPVLQDDDNIDSLLSTQLLPTIGNYTQRVTSIHFYGAGVLPQQEQRICRILTAYFPQAKVEAASDLLGAARALFQLKEGVACILGTGSNSGYYDGNKIVRNVPPLGFILGDEGSGAVMGKAFLGSLYKGLLPDTLRESFEQSTGLNLSEVINRVYRSPMPNRFLASLAPFIAGQLDCVPLREMVVEHFRNFFRRNVAAYGSGQLPVGVVGSIAHHFSACVREAAQSEKIILGSILQSPMEGLVTYHSFS